jgi:hypothetical protein
MTYSIDDEGLQGAFPLQRVIPGSGNTCSELSGNSLQAVDINAGMDGSWFEPATSGQGFFIDAYTNPRAPILSSSPGSPRRRRALRPAL